LSLLLSEAERAVELSQAALFSVTAN